MGAVIRRWHWLRDGPCPTDRPFVTSHRMLDVGSTMVGSIMNAPANCVAVAIRWDPINLSGRVVADCERAARRKGIRIFWVRRRRASRVRQ